MKERASLVADGEALYRGKRTRHTSGVLEASESVDQAHVSTGNEGAEILRPEAHTHSEDLHRRELSDGTTSQETLAVHIVRLEVRNSSFCALCVY